MGGIQVDMMPRPKLFFQSSGIAEYPVRNPERFSPGDAGALRSHVPCFGDCLVRAGDTVFIGIHLILSFSFTGERAVPAGAVAYSRDEEDHLCAFMAEPASGSRERFHLSGISLVVVQFEPFTAGTWLPGRYLFSSRLSGPLSPAGCALTGF
ncbi:MAG: hypothetical protein BWY93_02077 [Euryarchaeota archaeon ADurb.BinA087]|nr:MAG: hypothetical protein BWY93_02077 [Euryarchaeota archaeon ADurb.BinA087]